MSAQKPIVSESFRRVSIGRRRRGGSSNPPLFLDQSLSFEDKAKVRAFLSDAAVGRTPSQHFARTIGSAKKVDKGHTGTLDVKRPKESDQPGNEIKEDDANGSDDGFAPFDDLGSANGPPPARGAKQCPRALAPLDGNENSDLEGLEELEFRSTNDARTDIQFYSLLRRGISKGPGTRASARKKSSTGRDRNISKSAEPIASDKENVKPSAASKDTGKLAPRTRSARKKRKLDETELPPKVPPKRRTYDGSSRKRLSRPISFICQEQSDHLSSPSAFALIEGVGGGISEQEEYASGHPLDRAKQLPFRGRTLELPGAVKVGEWSGQLVQDGSRKRSALFRDKIDDLHSLRIELRHKDAKTLGCLKDAIRSQPSMTFNVINPMHSRQQGFASQIVMDEEEIRDIAAASEGCRVRGSDIPFLGSLSLAVFRGFSTVVEENDFGASVADNFLDGCRLMASKATSTSANDLLPVKQYDPSPYSTEGIAGVSFPCRIECSDDYYIIIAQDDASDAVVAIDVVFEDPARTSHSSDECHSTAQNDVVALTEENLQIHTQIQDGLEAEKQWRRENRVPEDEHQNSSSSSVTSSSGSRSDESSRPGSEQDQESALSSEQSPVNEEHEESGRVAPIHSQVEKAATRSQSAPTATTRSLSSNDEESRNGRNKEENEMARENENASATGPSITDVLQRLEEESSDNTMDRAFLGKDEDEIEDEVEDEEETAGDQLSDEAGSLAVQDEEGGVGSTGLGEQEEEDAVAAFHEEVESRSVAAAAAKAYLATEEARVRVVLAAMSDAASTSSGVAESDAEDATADAAPRQNERDQRIFLREFRAGIKARVPLSSSGEPNVYEGVSVMSIHTTESDYACPPEGADAPPPEKIIVDTTPSSITPPRSKVNAVSLRTDVTLDEVDEELTNSVVHSPTQTHQTSEAPVGHDNSGKERDSFEAQVALEGSKVMDLEVASTLVTTPVPLSNEGGVEGDASSPESYDRNNDTAVVPSSTFAETAGTAELSGTPHVQRPETASVYEIEKPVEYPCTELPRAEANSSTVSTPEQHSTSEASPISSCDFFGCSVPVRSPSAALIRPGSQRLAASPDISIRSLEQYSTPATHDFDTGGASSAFLSQSPMYFFTPNTTDDAEHRAVSPEQLSASLEAESDGHSDRPDLPCSVHSTLFGAQDVTTPIQGDDRLVDEDGATAQEPEVLSTLPFFLESPGANAALEAGSPEDSEGQAEEESPPRPWSVHSTIFGREEQLTDADGVTEKARGVLMSTPFYLESPGSFAGDEGVITRDVRTVLFGAQDTKGDDVSHEPLCGNDEALTEQPGTILSRPLFLQSSSYDENEKEDYGPSASIRSVMFCGDSPSSSAASPTVGTDTIDSSLVEEPELVSLTPFFIEAGNGSAGSGSKSDNLRCSNKMRRRTSTSSTHRGGSLPSCGHSLMRLVCLAAFLLVGTNTPSSLHRRGQWKRTPAGSETDLLNPNLRTPSKDEAVLAGTSSRYEYLFISF